VKRNTIPTNESFVKQASNGVIRKGGVESRLDVVTNDYVPPAKTEMKRSKSTPAVVSMHPHVVSFCIPTYTSRIGLVQTPAIASSPRRRRIPTSQQLLRR
jgi:hypothetical protein